MSDNDPITMARIAPVLSFLVCFLGRKAMDAGGIGHGFKGGPHKSWLSENEESGKFWREDGIDPLSRLWLTFKSRSRVVLRSGTGPEKELNWRFREVRWVRFSRVSGMIPVKELNDRSKLLIWGETRRGRSPEKLLF